MKEGLKLLIKINRQEMQYLQNNGVSFGEDGMSSTSGHHRAWYVTESRRNVELLRKCHKLNIIEKK